MRVMVCLFLLLPACATHAVRCDAHLRPINAQAPDPGKGAAAAADTARAAPGGMP
jgi:hypothetical protein